MQDLTQLKRFYENSYGLQTDDRFAGWRRVCAVNKADHIVALCRRGDISPRNVVEVGCGDGSLLAELAVRGFGQERSGYEISEAAARLAGARDGISSVTVFDGLRIDCDDDTFDLAVISHVLEHVPEPLPLLQECARVAKTVVVEVPLEDNLSGRRGKNVERSRTIGHLHHLNRRDMRDLFSSAGLTVKADLLDPLPLAVHRYYANSQAALTKAALKWTVRRSLSAISSVGERFITLHYAALLTKNKTGV